MDKKHKEMIRVNFKEPYKHYASIIDVIEDFINHISREMFENDPCKPKYNVSVLWEGDKQEIVLTIEHLGQKFSRTLFPVEKYFYGYKDLQSIMVNMYNQTM